jgi:hypothetical protein
LTAESVFVSIDVVKIFFAALLIIASQTSCTTLANRRDLYSPQPDPDLDWHRQAARTSHTEETAPPPNQ